MPDRLIQDLLEAKSIRLHHEASLSQGDERDALLHKAHQLESVVRTIDRWASSRELSAAARLFNVGNRGNSLSAVWDAALRWIELSDWRRI
jgi:hypothetical protein